MAVNLDKNRGAILQAWNDVLSDKSPTDWALYGYEGLSNDLKLVCTGDGGIEELKEELSSGQIMYAFLKVTDPKTSLPKCVLINWQGEGAPLVRKGTCANHFRDVAGLLRGAHVTINARNDEEVDPDVVIEKVAKSTGSVYSFNERSTLQQTTTPVGTTYQRVIPRNEINISERDKFWQKEEEEEKKRLAEEKRKKEEMKEAAERERQQRELEKMSERESPARTVSQRNDSVRQEAEELIKMRNFDPRAVFERNTSTGQLNSRTSNQSTGDTTQKDIIKNVNVENNLEINATTSLQMEENIRAVVNENEKDIIEEGLVCSPNPPDYLDIDNLGLRAEALYDYQAADETEISFDPGDIITHIDQIDTGWWQGLGPDGTFGLFPANYVQLLD